eukprot:12302407-Alexandrium_andersonii.AAC.1
MAWATSCRGAPWQERTLSATAFRGPPTLATKRMSEPWGTPLVHLEGCGAHSNPRGDMTAQRTYPQEAMDTRHRPIRAQRDNLGW